MKTAEQERLPDDIVAFIQECRAKEHSESHLIAVLQRIQNRFGYLSRANMDQVSQLLQVPAARVTGVATFYHFFSFVPKGEHRITICMGTACFVKGAGKLLDRLREMLGVKEGATTKDRKFSLECARCLGACALAPVMVVDDKVYGNVRPEELPKILAQYGYGKTQS
jgi:NADH:ubiquinone oxidoreductase subunit E